MANKWLERNRKKISVMGYLEGNSKDLIEAKIKEKSDKGVGKYSAIKAVDFLLCEYWKILQKEKKK